MFWLFVYHQYTVHTVQQLYSGVRILPSSAQYASDGLAYPPPALPDQTQHGVRLHVSQTGQTVRLPSETFLSRQQLVERSSGYLGVRVSRSCGCYGAQLSASDCVINIQVIVGETTRLTIVDVTS